MNTSQNKYDAIENIIFNEGLIIKSVDFSSSFDRMFIQLDNDLVFIAPTTLYKRLSNATAKSLKKYELIAGGTGIHWPDLDEDLSLKGFLKEFLKQKVHTEKEL